MPTITYECITKRGRLEAEDVSNVLNHTDDLAEYTFMNYLERELVRQNGQEFLIQASDKVQFIMGFILQHNYEGLFNMYNRCFDIYMEGCNNNILYANGFNIVFVVLIHMAKKILRKTKDFN